MKELTLSQIATYSNRIDEISKLLDQCGPNDDDVVNNLINELTEIETIFERELKISKFKLL